MLLKTVYDQLVTEVNTINTWHLWIIQEKSDEKLMRKYMAVTNLLLVLLIKNKKY